MVLFTVPQNKNVQIIRLEELGGSQSPAEILLVHPIHENFGTVLDVLRLGQHI
jgi:hypothetical protein